MADGKYESAITYYRTAQAIYARLELAELANALGKKIAAARAGIAARDSTKAAEAASRESAEKERDTREGLE